ncbi:MAG: S8 family peptidase [Bacteroidetes bacterium]|nr:S8 family peptidase [Bacteroidota bacterium]
MVNGSLRAILSLTAIVFLLALPHMAAAQTYTCYVQLRDKAGSTYDIRHPEAFLSPRALERRRLQHIPIADNDLPVSGVYIRQVTPLCRIAATLRWTNGLLIRTDDISVISRLQALPFVTSVHILSSSGPNTRVKVLDVPSASRSVMPIVDTALYGSARRQTTMIHLDALHDLGYWGDGVVIAIMDAGFLNADSVTFMQRVFDEGRLLYTWNFVFDVPDVYGPPRANPHGCNTFSCIAANTPYQMIGTAPNASFMLFQTEDNRSETIAEEYYWAAAAERADSMGADVFSTSLGYTTFDASDAADSHTYADMTGHTTPIARAVNTAASKGIIVVNSAGNEGDDAWHYIGTPGDADSGVSIGAVDPSAQIAGFSSRGPNSSGGIKPDMCAQGAPAALSTPSSMLTAEYGTSFSCPITAGAFACLRQAFPSVPNMEMVEIVRQSCTQYMQPDSDYGYGIPDFGLAYDKLKLLYPQDTLLFVDHPVGVYPNPFSTTIRVGAAELVVDTIVNTADLYDISGQKVWTASVKDIMFDNNVWELTPPANLAAGVYILAINKTRKYRMEKL